MHRKVYKNTYGPIPKDETGRSYEIHHIDGNHNNNEISNLKMVSIQEHYDIHYAQGDWGACQAIVRRMNKSIDEISNECSILVKKRINEGSMPWLSSEYARYRELEKVKNGTHNWQGSEAGAIVSARNLQRSKDGTNPFSGDRGSKLSKKVQADRIKNGTHHFSGTQGSKHSTELNYKLLREGRHPSQNPVAVDKIRKAQLANYENGTGSFQIMLKNGTHPTQYIWTCPHCNRTGKGASNAKRHHFDNCKLKDKK